MKKKELEQLEKLNKEKKLTEEVKNKIIKKALNNFLIALDILLLFIIFIIAAEKLPKDITAIIYKISSIVFLIFTIILFEIAYKKDNDEIAIHGIEILILSIVILLTPYTLIERPTMFSAVVGAYIAAYFILKNLFVYLKARREYELEKSDISQIIKKESQDSIAQEEKNKINKQESVKRKRGRPKKASL